MVKWIWGDGRDRVGGSCFEILLNPALDTSSKIKKDRFAGEWVMYVEVKPYLSCQWLVLLTAWFPPGEITPLALRRMKLHWLSILLRVIRPVMGLLKQKALTLSCVLTCSPNDFVWSRSNGTKCWGIEPVSLAFRIKIVTNLTILWHSFSTVDLINPRPNTVTIDLFQIACLVWNRLEMPINILGKLLFIY